MYHRVFEAGIDKINLSDLHLSSVNLSGLLWLMLTAASEYRGELIYLAESSAIS